MSASDTPRTNGMEVDAEDVFRFGSPDSKWVESNKVRQLERELNQWRKVADDLAEVVSNEMLEEYGYRRPCLQLDAYNKLKATHDPQP